jgi:hypothetical protein
MILILKKGGYTIMTDTKTISLETIGKILTNNGAYCIKHNESNDTVIGYFENVGTVHVTVVASSLSSKIIGYSVDVIKAGNVTPYHHYICMNTNELYSCIHSISNLCNIFGDGNTKALYCIMI